MDWNKPTRKDAQSIYKACGLHTYKVSVFALLDLKTRINEALDKQGKLLATHAQCDCFTAERIMSWGGGTHDIEALITVNEETNRKIFRPLISFSPSAGAEFCDWASDSALVPVITAFIEWTRETCIEMGILKA